MIDALPTLVASHRAGDLELPKDLIDLWGAYERIEQADCPRGGALPTTRSAIAAAMIDAAMTGQPLPGETGTNDGSHSIDFAHAWEAARRAALEQLTERLTQYDRGPVYKALQDALADAVETFSADIKAAGPWANVDPSNLSGLLDADPDVIAAVRRILNDGPRRYLAIRTAWRHLRSAWALAPGDFGYEVGQDPDQPLGEVYNWREIAPAWKPGDSADFKRGMPHAWFADLVRRGAEFWAPAPHEQLAKHAEAYPPGERLSRGFVDPFAFTSRPPAA